MPRPDEGLIHEWLDGELSPEEEARVARLVETDAEWAAAAAEARGLIAASSRILSALDVVPGDVVPAGSRAAPRAPSRFTVRPWMRVAAGIMLVAGTGYLVADRTGEPTLDFQAASEQVEAVAPPALARADVPSISPAPSPTVSAQRGRESGAGAATPPVRQGVEQVREERVFADAAVADVANSASAVASDSAAAKTSARPSADTRSRAALAATQRAEPEADRTPLPAVTAELAPAAPSAPTAGAVQSATPAAARALVGATRDPEFSKFALSGVVVTGAASGAGTSRALDGCWRTATTAGADSVLAAPAILRSQGDTLVIAAGAPARPATVLRVGLELIGTMDDASGRRVAFNATRVACPATPSPR